MLSKSKFSGVSQTIPLEDNTYQVRLTDEVYNFLAFVNQRPFAGEEKEFWITLEVVFIRKGYFSSPVL